MQRPAIKVSWHPIRDQKDEVLSLPIRRTRSNAFTPFQKWLRPSRWCPDSFDYQLVGWRFLDGRKSCYVDLNDDFFANSWDEGPCNAPRKDFMTPYTRSDGRCLLPADLTDAIKRIYTIQKVATSISVMFQDNIYASDVPIGRTDEKVDTSSLMILYWPTNGMMVRWHV